MNLLKKLFGNKTFWDIIVIFILSLVPLFWFKGNSIMVGHDNVYPLDPIVFLAGRLFTWIPFNFGQSQSSIMGTIPIHFFDFLPYALGLSLQLSQKITYVFWFFSMSISMYVLAKEVRSSRVFALTSVLFYTINFFLLNAWFIGERTKFSAYAAFPLILTVFIRLSKNKISVLQATVINIIILFFLNGGGLFGLPLFGGFFVGIGVFILFFISLHIKRKNYRIAFNIMKVTLLTFLGFIIINSYYIVPSLSQLSPQITEGLSKSGGTSGSVNWASEISANSSYLNILRFQGVSEWYDNAQHPYAKFFLTSPILITISFVWIFIICLALFIKKKKENEELVLYFFLVFLLGIFFAAGTHPPLGFLYVFLLEHVPGFFIFRSPYFKFAPAIFLPASILIAFTIDSVRGKLKPIIFICFAVLILTYHFPYFTGNFFNWTKGFSTRNEVPSYVYDFGKWAQSISSDDRMLLLPGVSETTQYDVYDWGYLSLQALPTLVTDRAVLENDNKLTVDERQLVVKLYHAIDDEDVVLIRKLTSVLGIKYFVLRDDFVYKSSFNPSKQSVDYQKSLTEMGYMQIKKIGRWIIYENLNKTLPKLFLSSSMAVMDDESPGLKDFYDFYDYSSSLVSAQVFAKFPFAYSSQFIVPRCLNCRYEIPPTIEIPDRRVLPDSPLYPLVLLSEAFKARHGSDRERIYDDLGFTLKRAGEIWGMTLNKKKIESALTENYLSVLKDLVFHFSKISNPKEKFESAEDVENYMAEESRFLRMIQGSRVLGGDQAGELEKIFSSIQNVREAVFPYLFHLDSSTNKLYQFSLYKDGDYNLYFKTSSLGSVVKEKGMVKFTVDSSNDFTPPAVEGPSGWTYLGNLELASGYHTVSSSLPDVPDLVLGYALDKTFPKSAQGETCFSPNIANFDYKRTYRMDLEFPSNSPNEYYLYIERMRNGESKLDLVYKLDNTLGTNIFKTFIFPSSIPSKVTIDICSKNLKLSDLDTEIKMTIKEIIRPELLVMSKQGNLINEALVSYEKINPVEYKVSVFVEKVPVILGFSERYDNLWELEKFDKNHIKINGFANGWIIDKPGTYDLKLNYRPQKMFYIGGFISVLSLIAVIACFVIIKNKR